MIKKGWLKDEPMTAFFKMVLRWLSLENEATLKYKFLITS